MVALLPPVARTGDPANLIRMVEEQTSDVMFRFDAASEELGVIGEQFRHHLL